VHSIDHWPSGIPSIHHHRGSITGKLVRADGWNMDGPVWLYDGVCALCCWAVRYALRHEQAPVIRFVAMQSGEGRGLAKIYRLNPDDPKSFLFIEAGQAYAKGDAVLAIARYLRGPARLIGWARLLPRPVRDWLYDRIAGNRYRLLRRRPRCLMPDPGAGHRFTLPDGL
jgi:predicted DCC family thiol-disulfide oxidoreductase YuxK